MSPICSRLRAYRPAVCRSAGVGSNSREGCRQASSSSATASAYSSARICALASAVRARTYPGSPGSALDSTARRPSDRSAPASSPMYAVCRRAWSADSQPNSTSPPRSSPHRHRATVRRRRTSNGRARSDPAAPRRTPSSGTLPHQRRRQPMPPPHRGAGSRLPPPLEEPRLRGLQQPHRRHGVPCDEKVPDGLVHLVLPGVPVRRADEQVGGGLGTPVSSSRRSTSRKRPWQRNQWRAGSSAVTK